MRYPSQWRHLDVHVLLLWGDKVGGYYNRLLVLRDESVESCLTEQRCSVNLPCVPFCCLSDL